MVPPEIYTIERQGAGLLSTMARPRGGTRLAGELTGLAEAGVTVLVSLLSAAEEGALGLDDEPLHARAAGLEFLRLTTPDLEVPARLPTLALARGLGRRLETGQHVVLHCRAGIGRSSTLAAAVLLAEGVAPDDAWGRITRARGLPVPDTAAQAEFIRSLDPSQR